MAEQARDRILEHARLGAEVRLRFFEERADDVGDVARAMAVALAKGGKLLFCGNGPCAADCQRMAACFVHRIRLERPPLPAMALTTDASVLTAVANDGGFDQIFEKQVQALGQPGDVLLVLSMAGSSPSLLAACRAAKRKGLATVGLTGRRGGELVGVCDHLLQVPSKDHSVIQEVHTAAANVFCQLVDYYLFEAVLELNPYLADDPASS